ncbi:hypothetical protein JS278_01853 [Acidipropionibacterium virtanenii]|uniref:N-acetyltransferase domain-containing protein n=2 Tax=Acidipropionibacterium virtanenii TaxID=2057246 RepID=A0A344UUR3_9ACTN|nr:hypothetical protein JS278_01853 [Acidipropionibacterium virtanenii]
MTLRPLTAADRAEALAAEQELAPEHFQFLPDRRENEPWPDFVARIRSQEHGEGLTPGYVPATFLVAEVDGRLIGRVSIRHELNDVLRRFGGHIGYGVRPEWRRHGYATDLLRRALAACARMGIDPALVTCDDDNTASIGVIENCAGVLHDRGAGPDGGIVRRYWMPTTIWPA